MRFSLDKLGTAKKQAPAAPLATVDDPPPRKKERKVGQAQDVQLTAEDLDMLNDSTLT